MTTHPTKAKRRGAGLHPVLRTMAAARHHSRPGARIGAGPSGFSAARAPLRRRV